MSSYIVDRDNCDDSDSDDGYDDSKDFNVDDDFEDNVDTSDVSSSDDQRSLLHDESDPISAAFCPFDRKLDRW